MAGCCTEWGSCSHVSQLQCYVVSLKATTVPSLREGVTDELILLLHANIILPFVLSPQRKVLINMTGQF